MSVLRIKPEQDPWQLAQINQYQRIDLVFDRFTDGRAYTQAYVIRYRLNYTGVLRATGEVLVDQVAHMARVGFDEIQLRADQSVAQAKHALVEFKQYYQKMNVNHAAKVFLAETL